MEKKKKKEKTEGDTFAERLYRESLATVGGWRGGSTIPGLSKSWKDPIYPKRIFSRLSHSPASTRLYVAPPNKINDPPSPIGFSLCTAAALCMLLLDVVYVSRTERVVVVVL